MTVYVNVSEIENTDTDGMILVAIPKVSYFSFTYNGLASTLPGGINVQNSEWSFTDAGAYWLFTRTSSMMNGSSSRFGMNGVFNSGAVGGQLNFSAIIINGSGL